MNAHGVAIGSYARMIIKNYIDKEDFWDDKKLYNSALYKADQLVRSSLEYLGDKK